MTDNEIIKALECCIDCNCKECPCCRIIDGGTYCTEIDEEEILDLINRQKAEIESLKKKNNRKCGTCVFAKPTKAFGGSKYYVECTNQEHLEKYCHRHKSSKVRQRTNPACKRYKEMEDDKNDTTGKN